MSAEMHPNLEEVLGRLFLEWPPFRILETGTFLGRGSTTSLWRAAKQSGVGFELHTIECNPHHHLLAAEYFAQQGMKEVTGHQGLSIAREEIPSDQDIKKVHQYLPADIKRDHEPDVAFWRYSNETDHSGPSGLLTELFPLLMPSVVLLDSGGHLGLKEFMLVRDLAVQTNHPGFLLILDDIRHVKHYRSWQIVKNDPHFRVLEERLDENFGWGVARWTP